MTPFDHALTHVLDTLARADAGQVGRASRESLDRLIALTRSTPQPTLERTPAARTPSPTPQPKREATTRTAPTAQEAPAESPTSSSTPETEAPRRKLGLAEQLRAAMAAKPTTPPMETPEPTAAAVPPEVLPAASSLPPEGQLEHLNETIMAGAYDPRVVVLGEGSARSELIFIGSAPGQAEVAAKSPLAGEVGALFDKIVATMRLRKSDLYITNLLKRPVTGGNASPAEIEADLPLLHAEIEIVRPKCLVTLGEFTLATLVGKEGPIEEQRGQWHSFRGIPVMATFHPGYLCKNGSKEVRRLFWEDMLQVLELLAKPITPKQRDFFK